MMTDRHVYSFDEPSPVPDADLAQLLGGKGASLATMANELHLPVPPGFTITTEACRAYFATGWPASLDDELRNQTARLGERLGRRFGDPDDPLLVSVRSGAPVSMPGMMDTILNLGLNDATAAGLARAVTGDGRDFATDCLARFRQGYRAVIGDVDVPDDVWAQLRNAVEAVFRSWNTDRARAYRQRESIPDDLGTAVTVQAMVFGNRGPESGTGVLFTRNPSTGEANIYGDFMFDAQGEDVVAGTHTPLPVSVLDERMPSVARELRDQAAVLERHYADLCDIEFTIEEGRLWLLQVRVGKRSPRAALRIAIDMAEDPDFPLTRAHAVRRVARHLADPPRVFVHDGPAPEPIAVGRPASPGVATGGIVTSSQAAVSAADAGESVILVRSETSPEDVSGMARSVGVLTARGGLASHAAVVARGWGIPAVVGAEGVRPADDRVEIDGRVIGAGERITIDGSTGEVFLGELAGRWEVAPEAATLINWASDLGFELARSTEEADAASATPSEPAVSEVAADDVLRALFIKGTAAPEQLADSLLAEAGSVRKIVDRLTEDLLAEAAAADVRLTTEGKLRAAALFDADRALIGDQRSVELLEDFHAFDARTKDLVTAWQIRDLATEQVVNDHTDPDYDGQVLDDLVTLHHETAEWLAPLVEQLRRFGVYISRLELALALARKGDQRYVASPRVDSFHTVWFELHEDLIRLAGKRRAEVS